ncbi:superoxide dismutase family protein [Sphingopyxis sp. LC363]|uniref:superoxide dismutase family protein n=1 Tax=Sphingopyxis sp. LC363 TaxID=1120705 RepID=UPI001F31F32C|nr:superoxide dismutase family protein [Sphingopyxis sp. LC363]
MTVAISAVLAGCDAPETSTQAPDPTVSKEGAAGAGGDGTTVESAAAILRTAGGEPAGQATATMVDGRVKLALQVEGLPTGRHGAHVHMTGKCDAPKFESAGGHWNPTGAKHGLEDPAGQHAGDMPNLVVGEDGRGTLSYELQGATFEGLLDSDGSAMVIHASVDDQKTDPSGNSGDRIACGIFETG